MKKLNYNTLNEIGYEGYLLKNGKEKILQFGEGNFLRAFVDYFVDIMNEKADFNAKVVVCQPIENGLCDVINSQDGLYNLYFRGFENGKKVNTKRVISSISRCINPYKQFDELMKIAHNPDLRFITCNTTEAGIVYDAKMKIDQTPQISFPAKLTRFLYERYTAFNGDNAKGFIILSCELIDDNGKELEKCVLRHANDWNLEQDFIDWITNANEFCSTLVDRIVTGYPKAEANELNQINGYEDKLLDTAEVFGLWVIEGSNKIKEELPFEKAGLPIIVTDDHKPYKKRKVSILNGAHTSMVMGAYLAGQTIVRDCMNDEVIKNYMLKILHDEVIPTLTLDKNDMVDFANSVVDRFLNPFIDHELLAICLNSTSKMKARVLPSFLTYVEKFGKLPKGLTTAFAFYIMFYIGDKAVDDENIINWYNENKKLPLDELAVKVLANKDFWDMDLTTIPNFASEVSKMLFDIKENGTYKLMKDI